MVDAILTLMCLLIFLATALDGGIFLAGGRVPIGKVNPVPPRKTPPATAPVPDTRRPWPDLDPDGPEQTTGE